MLLKYNGVKKDIEFINNNKVTRIINCASSEVTNEFENIGVKYLTFDWKEIDSQVILDDRDGNIQKVERFIEESWE